jgi:hypothetical protein
MLVGMDVILGMRHQPEYVAGGVAQPGDIQGRAVRVGGVGALRERAVGTDLGEGDLILYMESGE